MKYNTRFLYIWKPNLIYYLYWKFDNHIFITASNTKENVKLNADSSDDIININLNINLHSNGESALGKNFEYKGKYEKQMYVWKKIIFEN